MEKYTPEVATLWYHASEILLGQEIYSLVIDVWSVGMIFAEMVANEPLFSDESEIEQLVLTFRRVLPSTRLHREVVESFLMDALAAERLARLMSQSGWE